MKRFRILRPSFSASPPVPAHAASAPNQLVRGKRTDKIIELLKKNKDTSTKDHKKALRHGAGTGAAIASTSGPCRAWVLGKPEKARGEREPARPLRQRIPRPAGAYLRHRAPHQRGGRLAFPFRTSAGGETVVGKTEVKQEAAADHPDPLQLLPHRQCLEGVRHYD